MDNKLWSSRPNSDKGLHATYWAPNEPNLTPLVERSVQIHWNGISGTGKGGNIQCSILCHAAGQAIWSVLSD